MDGSLLRRPSGREDGRVHMSHIILQRKTALGVGRKGLGQGLKGRSTALGCSPLSKNHCSRNPTLHLPPQEKVQENHFSWLHPVK